MSFTAKYDGRCGGCDETIYQGDQLVMVDGRAVHEDCVAEERKEAERRRPTCARCWQEISLSGACGCEAD